VGKELFGRSPAGRAIRSNLFFVPQKRISTTIPNAKHQNQNHLMNQKNHSADNIPQLRFPEFVGEWEKKKLGEVADFKKGKGISKSDIVEDGTTECIRYGELYTHYGETINLIKSKTNIDIKNLVFSNANDVIIPASGETKIDIATASCVLKSGVVLGGDLNIIKTQNNGVWLSYYLNSKKKMDIANLAQGISVVHLYSSQLSLLNLNFPTLPEQTRIANFLTAVDEKIQALKKKKGLLEAYKKGVMQRLFSQGEKLSEAGLSGLKDEQDFDANNPKILKSSKSRFRQEDGSNFPDWEVKKLGEVTYKTDNKNKKREILPVYSISNINGFVPQSEQFDGIDSVERGYDTSLYKIIENNTFAYNPARINVGSIGFSGNIGRVIVSSLYVCFKTNDNINDLFFNHYLNTIHFKDSVLRNGEGGVRIYLFYENFSDITINLPSLPEQTRIANFLSAIDDKIKHNAVQIQKIEVWKKGLLQKMFV
jgi:type I restriction enzyme S subunit